LTARLSFACFDRAGSSLATTLYHYACELPRGEYTSEETRIREKECKKKKEEICARTRLCPA
jgi:hypothetical protein